MRTTQRRRRAVCAVTALLLASGLAAWPAVATAPQRAGNQDPVALNDAYDLPEDARLLVRAPGVRANDVDPEGKRLRVRIVRGPRHGDATLSKRGRLRYQPDRNWSGTDRLVYVARDPAGNKDRARVRFTVSPVNDAPSLSMRATTPVPEGSTSRITLTAHDPEDDPLSYSFDCDGNGSFEVGPQPGRIHHCAYADEGDQTPAGRVTDSHGARTTLALQITVTNVRPVVTAPDDQATTAGTPTQVDLGSFTDPGPDGPWQVEVSWGDGSTDSFAAASPGDLGTRNHTYADTGDPLEVYRVVVTVAEAGGSPQGSATFFVDVTG